MRAAIGIAGEHQVPSVDAVYRFMKRLRLDSRLNALLQACIAAIQESLREIDPEYGKDSAVDSTPMRAYANGQKFVRKGGPERKRYSDPDASWGHHGATSSQGRHGFYGYKTHAQVCTKHGWPMSWEVETAKASELPHLPTLLERSAAAGFRLRSVSCDKGYDYKPVYDALADHHAAAIVCLNKRGKARDGQNNPACEHGPWTYIGADYQRNQSRWACPAGACEPRTRRLDADRFHPIIARSSPRFAERYSARTEIEREFGRLHEYHCLEQHCLRRLGRIKLHVDLVMLTRLGLALIAT